MKTYEFALILAGAPELTDDLCDALFAAGCDDSSPSQSCGVTRIIFDREADSLETAIRSPMCRRPAAKSNAWKWTPTLWPIR